MSAFIPGTQTSTTAGILPFVAEGEERTMATLAHLSVLLNLVTGFLGLVGALALYLIYKDRSKYIGFHALQSLLFQLAGMIIPTIVVIALWASSIILIFLFGVGLLLMPFALLASLLLVAVLPAMVIYGIIGALQCSSGGNFRYWMAGEWTEKIFNGGKTNANEQAMGG